MSQFVAGMKRLLGRTVNLEHVQFGHQFKRYDLFAASLVGEQVARDLEQECLARIGPAYIPPCVSACHALCHDIVDVAGSRHDAAQAGAKHSLERQYRCLEPIQPCSDRCVVHRFPL